MATIKSACVNGNCYVIKKIMNMGNEYLAGGGGICVLTQSQYDNLPSTKLSDGMTYVVSINGLNDIIHYNEEVYPQYSVKYLLVGGGGGGQCRGVGGGGGDVIFGDTKLLSSSMSVCVGTGGCYADGTASTFYFGTNSGDNILLCAAGGKNNGTSGNGKGPGAGARYGNGGGGGAGGNGGNGSENYGGSGGVGLCGYGGGGGGGGFCDGGGASCGGGAGGGALNGSGGYAPGCPATGCGGGGGGGATRTNCRNGGGRGGDGIVEICYLTNGCCGFTNATGGQCCYTCNGYCVHRFTSNGVFCIIS